MAIDPLKIPTRTYGEPIPVAPDMNDVVDKVDELVAAVNAGLATSNAIVGGDKFVQYLSSSTYGVPAEALTLNRLDPATILPGTEATVINPHPTPLTASAPSKSYVATIVSAGTSGAFQVPAYTGATDKVLVAWQEVVSADSFTALLPTELDAGKGAYAGLALRPLLIKIVGALGTATTITTTTPATVPAVTGPTVTGFLPVSAAVGASVTVTGTGFTKATAVAFNGTPASFQVLNSTTVVAVVPVGATTGPVAVTNSADTGTSAASFTVSATTTPTPAGDTVAPPITFVIPAAGATLTPGVSVVLTVNAFDNVGVQAVLFTNGATGDLLGQGAKNGNTYTLPYTPTTTGSLSLVATAADAAGNSQTATTNVTVQTATSTPVAQPAAPDFSGFDDVGNTVSVSHATLPVTELVYDLGGATGIPVPLTNVISVGNAAGQVTAYARANGSRPEGVRRNSQPFILAAAANNAPTVTLDSPQAGQTLAVNDPVVLNATPQDADGSADIKRVDYLDNGIKFAETTGFPYTVQRNITVGSHSFTARVYDMVGASGLSNTVLVTASSTTPTTPITGIQPGVAGAGQSGFNGLAWQKALTAAQKGPFPKVLIHNDDANAEQVLQIGVNECGLNGGLTQVEPRTDGASVTGALLNYYDGFGAERKFGELWQTYQNALLAYFKKNVEHATTDGSSLADWRTSIFAKYAAEFNRQKANYAAQGKLLQINYFLWNHGEADNNNTNYVAELNALMQQFRDLFNNQNLKILVIGTRGANDQYAPIRARQMAYVAQEPNATFWYDPNATYLQQDGVHKDAASMDREGEAWYNFVTGTTATTPPASGAYPISGSSAVWSGLNFTTTRGSFAKSGANYSATSGNGFGTNLGLANAYLPANQAGSIKITYASQLGTGAVLGLHTSATLVSVFEAAYAFLLNDVDGSLSVYNSGANPFTGLPMVLGRQYRWNRDANMIISVQGSQDGINWAIVAAFSQPYSGPLYPIGDILAGHQLQVPQGEGLVALSGGGWHYAGCQRAHVCGGLHYH
jgi:hypothetical protein